jgi:hypothetical protein
MTARHSSTKNDVKVVVCDTKVIDLTESLDDPTDVLFSGGTDITGAVASN